jgi:hypothetical protein
MDDEYPRREVVVVVAVVVTEQHTQGARQKEEARGQNLCWWECVMSVV